MFPHLKSAFWFPVTFILCRIIGHILILQEILFNYPTPSGAAELFAAAWILHIFWINQYFAGVRRRARRAKKAAAAATLEQDGGKEPLNDTSVTTAATSTSVSTTGFTRKAIQLRMRNSK
ncbi:hypothetical protein EC991_003584 [Linnemannia zychae]|nr:hypothetical protein EC991_003584 [Linnemannia zychae]